MQLYLIRHGEAAGDPHLHCRPPVDGFLTELGGGQAHDTGAALRNVRLDRVFASPLGRAIQTAQPIADHNGLPVETLPWLIEWRPATVTGECDPADYDRIMVPLPASGQRWCGKPSPAKARWRWPIVSSSASSN